MPKMEIVKFNNVNITFNGEQVVNNFTIDILPGEFVLLTGANGSGKTSLINALLGNIDYEGTILIEGQEKTRETELYKIVSYVSSDIYNNFFSGVVIDELIMPLCEAGLNRKQAKAEATALLTRFNCAHLKNLNICELGGGEKQLVALLSALLVNAKLLVLDEALSAMDEDLKLTTFEKLKTYLKEKGTALLFVTNEQCFSGFDKQVYLTESVDFNPTPIFCETKNATPLISLFDAVPTIKKRAITEGINAQICAGDAVCLTGKSGSGKSLLALAIAGLEPFDGKIDYESGLSKNDVKMLFQHTENFFIYKTVEEELKRFECNPSLPTFLEQTGLKNKFSTEIKNLSSGEKKLLALIELMFLNPRVLILDEMFANLNNASLNKVFTLLKNFCKNGGAIISIEHNLNFAKVYANKIIEVKKLEQGFYAQKSVQLGRFEYKNSPIHKTPAIIKILFTIAFIVLSFLANNWWHFGALFGFYLLCVVLSLTNPLKLFKPMLGLWVFAVFILILNGLTINWIEGTKMFLRLGLINLFVPLLTLTTSPYSLITAVPIRFIPTKFLKKCAFKISVVFLSSLTMLESSIDLTKNAMRAQKNLGISYKGSKLKVKLKNLSDVLSFLLKSLTEKSKLLANTLYLKGVGAKWYTK